jgi:hypothetical protein
MIDAAALRMSWSSIGLPHFGQCNLVAIARMSCARDYAGCEPVLVSGVAVGRIWRIRWVRRDAIRSFDLFIALFPTTRPAIAVIARVRDASAKH